MCFQEKLGTVLQRRLSVWNSCCRSALDETSSQEEAELAARAAHLAKAGLVSQAVVEFTSQRGVMGGFYAEAAGEKSDVAAAIREHCRPSLAGDDLPSGQIGRFVAITRDKRYHLRHLCCQRATNRLFRSLRCSSCGGVIALVRSTPSNLEASRSSLQSSLGLPSARLAVDESVQSQVEQYFVVALHLLLRTRRSLQTLLKLLAQLALS